MAEDMPKKTKKSKEIFSSYSSSHWNCDTHQKISLAYTFSKLITNLELQILADIWLVSIILGQKANEEIFENWILSLIEPIFWNARHWNVLLLPS